MGSESERGGKKKERKKKKRDIGVTEEECVVRSLGWMRFVIAGN